MGLHVLLLFLSFKCIFNDCCQTNYLTIYQIYLGQIFRTMAADMIKLSFAIIQRTLPWQPIFVSI